MNSLTSLFVCFLVQLSEISSIVYEKETENTLVQSALLDHGPKPHADLIIPSRKEHEKLQVCEKFLIVTHLCHHESFNVSLSFIDGICNSNETNHIQYLIFLT